MLVPFAGEVALTGDCPGFELVLLPEAPTS